MMCPEYLRSTKQLRSLDVDFRFLALKDAEKERVTRSGYNVALRLGVTGVQNVAEEMRRKKRARLRAWFGGLRPRKGRA